MKRLLMLLTLFACSSDKSAEKSAKPASPPQASTDPQLTFEEYKLKNGLTVILHEDHRVPLVAVNVWYQVGSQHEVKGRTGFAHLFEHLMFQGSRHVGDDAHLKMLEEAGATDLNGTTMEDRTNYIETVPREELPLALWLESDRMGFLLDTLDQAKLDNQRDVVKNERRQSFEGQPYGLAQLDLYRALFPAGHPYREMVIGLPEDLNAASLDDVRSFFKTYYTPSNATLVLAGDFDPKSTRELVEKAFGGLAVSPLPKAPVVATPPLTAQVRVTSDETIAPLAKVAMGWLTAPVFTQGDVVMDVVSHILAQGKGSRLYRALVQTQVAQSVHAEQDSKMLTSVFTLDAVVAPGHTPEEVEKILDAEMEKLAESGPTEEELNRTRAALETQLLHALEHLGGMTGRAEMLQMFHGFAHDTGHLPKLLAGYRAVTALDVQQAIKSQLKKDARVVQWTLPKPAQAHAPATEPPAAPPQAQPRKPLPPVDAWRAQRPAPLSLPAPVLPIPEKQDLPSGVTLLTVPQPGFPLVAIFAVARGGSAMDPASAAGLAHLATSMLTEGMEGRDAAAQADAFANLGTVLHVHAGLESAQAGVVVHTRHAKAAADLLSRVLKNPTLSEDAFSRLRKRALTALEERSHDPMGLASQLFLPVTMGPEHPYGHPTSGTLTGLQAATLQQVRDMMGKTWTRKNLALVVVGDVSAAAAAELAASFSVLPEGEAPVPAPAAPANVLGGEVLGVAVPGAPQSIVLAGRPSLSAHDPDHAGVELLNAVLGGVFSSRLNMNLREDKGISYGAFSESLALNRTGVFVAAASVQADATSVGLKEGGR